MAARVSAYTTIDHYPIEDGLKVWDYDLEPGTIDLTSEPPHEERNQNDGSTELWFRVKPLFPNGRGYKLMSAKRVWVNHPMSGKKATN